MDIEKVLVSNKVSFGEENYKCFIGYLHNDHKIKPLHIMFPKTIVYIESYGGQTNWMNLIASLSTITNFGKPK